MTLQVPVIDLCADTPAKVAAEVHQACAEWGFFQVTGHGIPGLVSQAMISAARAFFACDQQQKRRISRNAENPWGFFDAELTKNTPDWKEIVDIGPERGAQRPQWPDYPANFRAAMEAYAGEAERVARELTGMLLRNLGDVDEREMLGFAEQQSFLRLNFYPLCENPAPADLHLDVAADDAAGRLGISHHTDAGALTVLQQYGPAGLQVLHNEQWHKVDVLPEALVINIGDVAQVWSNDGYPAPLHRVLANSREQRFSAAFFFNPEFDYSYAPLTQAVKAGATANYRPINWGEFRAGRAAGDYTDDGAEIQISDYRI